MIKIIPHLKVLLLFQLLFFNIFTVLYFNNEFNVSCGLFSNNEIYKEILYSNHSFSVPISIYSDNPHEQHGFSKEKTYIFLLLTNLGKYHKHQLGLGLLTSDPLLYLII